MKKLTSRAKQAESTKNKIYECGVKLIRKHGFDQVTVEQISKEAGVSVGTYYYYYESKFDLFTEIFHRADSYFKTEVYGHFESTDCKEQILEFFQRYADFALKDGVDMMKKLYVSDNKMFTVKGRDMQNVLLNVILDGYKSNSINSTRPAEELTELFFIAARGVIFEWCLYNGEIDLNKTMHKVISVMITGING